MEKASVAAMKTASAPLYRRTVLRSYVTGILQPPLDGENTVRWIDVVETAHSMPPKSAGSRSRGWRCQGIDVASTASAQPFVRAES